MRHDDTFISPELSEAVLNSYWDTQECAESYGREAYPAAGAITSRPRFTRADVGSMAISPQTLTIDPRLRQGIDDLLAAATQ